MAGSSPREAVEHILEGQAFGSLATHSVWEVLTPAFQGACAWPLFPPSPNQLVESQEGESQAPGGGRASLVCTREEAERGLVCVVRGPFGCRGDKKGPQGRAGHQLQTSRQERREAEQMRSGKKGLRSREWSRGLGPALRGAPAHRQSVFPPHR